MLSGNLRNMKQGIYAGLQLNKCAEICHTGNLAGNNRTNRIFLSCSQPGILIRELQAEGNSVALDVLNQNLQLLSDFQNGARIVHTSPGHL